MGEFVGSRKGIPNLRTIDLLEKAKELNVDAFELLLNVVAKDWKALGYDSPTTQITTTTRGVTQTIEVDLITLQDRVRAAESICSYLYPKRKAIEHTGDSGAPIHISKKLDLSKLTTEELWTLKHAFNRVRAAGESGS